jgi:hypothetical protein
MPAFSIDLSADLIVDSRTRAYFDEVARSFANECYRSSLVMLWTVVVCDLIYKLQTLRDIYGDTLAGKLLTDVTAKQVANPNSPDWELFLLDEVAKRTKMLEAADHVQLRNLQNLRHLSAHPVLTAADLLFRPTKETTRAQIRMALEAVLLKPALFSKRIIDALVEDIAANKAVLISRDKLKAYLEARYLPNMPRAIELELFRTLWKFCFRLKNTDTDANREINAEALAIIYKRDNAAVREMIQDDQPYFSSVGPEVDLLDTLVEFLADHGELHALLEPAAQILIQGRVDADINNRIKARFLFTDMATQLAALQSEKGNELAKMRDGIWQDLLAEAEVEGLLEDALALVIKIYGDSENYDAADRRFARFVEPALPKFTATSIASLLAAIEGNSQTYGRGRSKFDHPGVKRAADALGIDTTTYRSFTYSL